MTQSQLAMYLGVTEPAVSKWENGSSYPDITLLPALARLLGTDLNTLLSFKNDLSVEEVTVFINALSEKMLRVAPEELLDAVREKIKEYPNCYPLLLNCGMFLQGMSVYLGTAADKSREKEIIQYLERAAKSPDASIKQQANSVLINIFMSHDELDKAKAKIDKMPDPVDSDKQNRLISYHLQKREYTEAAKIAEESLVKNAMNTYMSMLFLIEIALQEKRFDDAWNIAVCISDFAQSVGLGRYYQLLPAFNYYVARKNAGKTIATLRELLVALDRWNTFDNSPLYTQIRKKEQGKDDPKLSLFLAKSLMNGGDFGFLADNPEYKKLMEQFGALGE